MGIEFIRKAAPAFHKGLDRSRIALGTPKLFSRAPDCAPRAYAATPLVGVVLGVGDTLGVCFDGERVVATSGITPIAIVANPPAELVRALQESFGEACGQVEAVHSLSGIVEISIC
jgi:hypothetical protein